MIKHLKYDDVQTLLSHINQLPHPTYHTPNQSLTDNTESPEPAQTATLFIGVVKGEFVYLSIHQVKMYSKLKILNLEMFLQTINNYLKSRIWFT